MLELSQGEAPRAGTPQHAIRVLLASMLALDRSRAQQMIAPGGSLDLLWSGAPRQREPSGHLEALVGEMPLVEIKPGEFFAMPSGRIVEGVQTENRKVLVGMFGSVEMPFVVQRIRGEWKVEAEPYFYLMMR